MGIDEAMQLSGDEETEDKVMHFFRCNILVNLTHPLCVCQVAGHYFVPIILLSLPCFFLK